MNYMDYLIGIRMETAKQLLETGTLSVTEVGARVGYEDSKYFSQLFKKCTSLTPSEYQKTSKVIPAIQSK
ncbi:helix-turn-helix transcriptional regulator [Paenibacillus sp. N3.4]|nr:helix-turn-helix transcriptional regulator [Paenibacillus sp. N3.4]